MQNYKIFQFAKSLNKQAKLNRPRFGMFNNIGC